MRKRTKSPKGPRAAATRGGRGRGRSRGRSRASNETQRNTQPGSQYSSTAGKSNYSRRGANNNNNNNTATSSFATKDNQNVTSADKNVPFKNNGVVGGPSTSVNGSVPVGENGPATSKPSGDFYLHKKFKKLTTTVISDSTEPTPSCSLNLLPLQNGLKTNDTCTSKTSSPNCTNVNDSAVTNGFHDDKSAIETTVNNSVHSESSSEGKNTNPKPGSSGTMVYKPKFRISTEAESKMEENVIGGSSSRESSTSVPNVENSERKTSEEREPGKIGKGLRLDRQSLDDRISQIIDKNQTLLESQWPEHFTKKLKSHTTRNSQSTNSHQQRTNQLAIMSGGSTTELQSTNTNTSSHHRHHNNGLVRHSSFDMATSGGTVEFLTNPLILKAQSDMLNTAFTQVVQNSTKEFTPSIVDLSFPVAPSSSSALIIPKKRRRLSPTPSRLCGGEVSELPVNEALLNKNYYQDVDMTVRVSNCSGAKVTIRTNNSGSGGSVQSAVSYGRLIDTVPSPLPIKGGSNGLFFGSSSLGPTLDEKGLSRLNDETTSLSDAGITKSSRNTSRSTKRKIARSSELIADQVPPPVETKATTPVESKIVTDQCNVTSKEETCPTTLSVISKSQDSSKIIKTEELISSKVPFQVLQSSATNPKRPNFLALKPVNNICKKSEVGVLPSPETPRVAKSYNQQCINGNAYTYLGFKVSTRSSYTCLFKPQPMFIPQHTDPKLSMYSNWQPCPKDPKDLDVSMSTNDSRVNGRKSPTVLYTSAVGKNCDTMTVSSPDNQPPISSPMSEESPSPMFAKGLRPPVTSLSRSSEAVPSSSSSGSKSLLSPNLTPLTTLTSLCGFPSVPRKTIALNQNIGRVEGSGPSSPVIMSSAIQQSLLKTSNMSAAKSSSSDLSSADETSNFGRGDYIKRRKDSCTDDGPLALTTTSQREGIKFLAKDDSNSASDSIKSGVVMNRSDGSRVRIMEGGFESNEDYTYIRGRGRGRYVCEACGIRCKKPSMLRKHLKTHTDLRPYTCKLCNFSFKTKGNLTKHQKSKSHHKKCQSMGIHPESSQSLETLGPSISDTNSDNDSDDDEDDEDDDNCGDLEQDMESDTQSEEDCDAASSVGEASSSIVPLDHESDSVEKQIAQSLLDLSRMSPIPVTDARLNSGSSGVLEWSRGRKQAQPLGFSVTSMLDNRNGVIKTISPINAAEAPIDLSVKARPSPAKIGEPEAKRLKLEKNGFVRAIGVVGEAQRWEPEEELISNGCLNLKKVLNTGSSSTPIPRKNVEEVPLALEIKQEKVETSAEITERLSNGYLTDASRKRQDSDTSSSSSTLASVTEKPSERSDTPVKESTPGSSCQSSAPVKLHQPWLSPPERSRKDSDRDSDVANDTKVGVTAIERSKISGLDDNGIKLGVGPSSDHCGELSNPSKLLPSLSSLKPQAEFRQPSGAQALVKEDGKPECNVCGKTFSRASQLTLHMNIHYLERPFRCDPCGVSFRTKGHLIKHRRSSSHDCKVYLTEAWGVANEENPRPFKCPDCKIAFRIHGHLAKHLRSKMHIMRMECLGKLPFGIYFEMEKSGMNLNEIDTTDCDMSLVSLQNVAKRIYGDTWMDRLTAPVEETP